MQDGATKSSGDLSATELEEPPLVGDKGGDHGGAQNTNAYEEGAGTVDRLTQSLNTPGGYWSYWIQEHAVQNDDGTFFVPDWLCQCLLIDREAVWHYAHYFSSQEVIFLPFSLSFTLVYYQGKLSWFTVAGGSSEGRGGAGGYPTQTEREGRVEAEVE